MVRRILYRWNNLTLTSIYRVVISSGTAIVNEENHTVIIALNSGETITGISFLFYHNATKVEPQNRAPVAGVINNLSIRFLCL